MAPGDLKRVALPAPAVTFLGGGGRDLDATKLPAEVSGLPAGTHVAITDPNGEELGLAIVDPDNQKLRVIALAADGFPRIDGALLGWRVERALRWRTQLGLPGPDHAYRLIHGAGDGLPGFTCDVLGRVAVVYAYGEGLRAVGRSLAESVVGFARLDGAVVKLRARGGADAVEQDVIGKVEDRSVATEYGVPFEIHPLGGLNAGLFTDMREHRRGLARFVADKRVLNLFSYTGALSVACARAGAKTVTSVDTSAGVQAWAHGNFKRSGLDDAARWKFETGDAARFLTRAIKDKERYDVVLIDPPTFSPARGGSSPWVLDRDYPELIAKAATVIPTDGLLWLAANTHELAALSKLAHKGLRLAGRTGAMLEQGGLPPDYPTLVAQPHDRYLQVCLLRLS
ncbi:MAG: class I SAM-dependent rRNA methyltransferase [Deltaproteobacteria bacterium]|nr:class I SAM-dependent rRNA methyltransferase [Deltaproteobacteria bacterium]